MRLTLHAKGTLINNRDRVDVLSQVLNGVLTFLMEPEDTQILKDSKVTREEGEEHTALLEWTWDAGARHGKEEIVHTVINLRRVPAVP